MALSSSAATRAMLTPGWTTQSPHCLQSSRQAHRSHFLSPIRQPQPDLVKRVTIIPRAVAAPPMPNKKPPVQDVPIHTAPCRRVMRLKTLHSEAPGKNNGEKELPVGRWVDDSLADTWQSCLLYHRSFYDQFMIHVARSSEAIFGKEKGPLSDPKMDPSLLGTDLGPQGQAIIDSDKGGCKLIALTCSFPKSRESLEEIADLWLPLVVLDDWLEQQSASEATEYAEWQKALWRMSDGGDYSQAVAAIPRCFATSPELHKAAVFHTSSLEVYSRRGAKTHPDWLRRYAWTMYLYSWAMIREVEAFRAHKDSGKLPTLAEYLSYRCISVGDPPCTVLGILESGIPSLSVERYKGAIPLIIYSGMITALANDSLVASKEERDGLISAVTIAGREGAVKVHNVLVDCFYEEATEFLANAEPGDSSQQLVDVIKASIFGGFMWENASHRHRPYVEETRQPLAIADCPEGQVTDIQDPLRSELRELMASICRSLPSEFDYN